MAVATEEYAKQTGRSCAACHLDPGGGGELTAAGKAFVDTRRAGTEPAAAGFYVKGFRLAVGYCHFLTAILWFGTILYVHLVLKPAYAASGLPRGEMRVGVVSMIVMGVTGTILTHFRVTSFAALLHSRFGILLLVKISLYLVMVLSALFVITVLGPRLKAKRHKPSLPEDTTELSADELAAFDGKEGRPARFACAGKIYDATRSPLWKQGVHMGRHNAGSDLTDALKQAPHGMEKVITLPLAGELIAAGNRKAPLHERVFFFMAHMNLTIVFIIILILSLWRWW
jgi:predicted heme/steroid binding protein/uncharacterized membrane protein